MLENELVRMREISDEDLEFKVKWVNDPEVNRFLHYDVPISLDNTKKWYNRVKNDKCRYDGFFETIDGEKIGFGGILNINTCDKTGELYITIGNKDFWGKGYGKYCVDLILNKGFKDLKLNKIYATTEIDNISACKLYESANFKKEGALRKHIFNKSKKKNVDQILYGILREEYLDGS